jgi:hypothetical protein
MMLLAVYLQTGSQSQEPCQFELNLILHPSFALLGKGYLMLLKLYVERQRQGNIVIKYI